MQSADKTEFIQLLNLCYSTLLKPLPPLESIQLWLAILEPFSLAQVRAALSMHMQSSKFPPVPADVVSRIGDGRVSADEAWSIAVAARDEEQSVCWTHEIRDAWFACKSAFGARGREDNAARMAFRATYERLCEAARQSGAPPVWTISRGRDPGLQAACAEHAVRCGRLTHEAARGLVPALAAPAEHQPAGQKNEVIQTLLQSLSGPGAIERRAMAREQAAAHARERDAVAKSELARRVAEYGARTADGGMS